MTRRNTRAVSDGSRETSSAISLGWVREFWVSVMILDVTEGNEGRFEIVDSTEVGSSSAMRNLPDIYMVMIVKAEPGSVKLLLAV